MAHRELGKISNVWSGVEDHGITTCNIRFESDSSYVQGFGNLCLDKEWLPRFVHDLCYTFRVPRFEDLVGKKCAALYAFDEYNAPIEGLESIDTGYRFILTTWRKRTGLKSQTPIEYEKECIKRDIERMKEQIKRSENRLKTVSKIYFDWEKA